MRDVNIKSENQSGGITAQNVNTGNNAAFNVNTPTPEKEGKMKRIFWWVFGLLSAGSALVGIVKYLS